MMPDKPRRRVTAGRMVLTRGSAEPYKAVLIFEDGHTSEHPFQCLKEGEAFIRGHDRLNYPGF